MNKAENLKQLRKKAKLTQKQLAEKCELNIGTIQGYEQGRYEPKYDAYKKLSEALHVDISDLMFPDGENEINVVELVEQEHRNNIEKLCDETYQLMKYSLNYEHVEVITELTRVLYKKRLEKKNK